MAVVVGLLAVAGGSEWFYPEGLAPPFSADQGVHALGLLLHAGAAAHRSSSLPSGTV